MNKTSLTLALVMLNLVVTDLALARRKDREGFNFGTSFSLLDGEGSSNPSSDNRNKGATDSSGSAVTPYVGVVLADYFNLGIMATYDSKDKLEQATNVDDGSRIKRERNTLTKSVGFFGRFLFGGAMYFEGGIGIYDERTSVNNEAASSEQEDGNFIGKREIYNVRGVGTGYHGGGGIEISIANDFYFTTSYMVRVYTLRDYKGEGSLGQKVGTVQTRSIDFGLAHYVK